MREEKSEAADGVINKPPADPLSKPPVLDGVSKGELGQGRAG